jgi:hypothetical protein
VPRDVPGYSWHAERADVLAKGGAGLWPPAVENNNYFCVSLFKGSRRQDVDFESLWVLGIDDVGTGPGCKVDGGVLLDRLGAPGWVIETSPGNQQWFYRFREGVVDEGLARLLVMMVRRAGDTTASQDGKLLTRLMRLPSGTNGKEDYLPDGYPTAVVFSPEVGDDEVGTLDDPRGVLASWDAAEVACGGVATADLPAAKRSSSSGLGKRVGKSVLDLIGDDPVGKKLLELGFVRGLTSSGLGVEVVCPWEDEHTVKTSTGAAYFPEKGGFECHHGHCQGRGYKELVGWLEDYLDQSGLWEGGVFGGLFSPVSSASGSAAGGDAGDVDTGDLDGDPPLFREVMVSQYVFIRAENKYLDRLSLELIPVESFNSSFRKDLRPWLGYMDGKTAKTMTPHAWFLGTGDGPVATIQTHWPGRGELFVESGVPMANTWIAASRPLSGRVVTEQDVGPWLDLVEMICASEGAQAALWVLDWFALMVGSPDIKPGWGLMIQSEVQGIGKDMMLWPILEVLGPRNAATPSMKEIVSGFNEFAARRLVSVSDLERNTRGATTAHDVYETIKPWTENTSRLVQINEKHRKAYRALNVSGWAITSNATDAMPLAESDRRFFVIMSRMKPWPEDRYASLKGWMMADGWQLIGEFLHQRYALMPNVDRARLMGRAPMTPGKRVMTLAAEDKLTSWTREQIEDGIWPDLMTSRDVQDAYERAGRRVLSNVPTGHKWGPILRRLGGELLRNGVTVKLPNGAITRMWAVRCPERYRQMDHNELTDTYMQQNGQFSPLLI